MMSAPVAPCEHVVYDAGGHDAAGDYHSPVWEIRMTERYTLRSVDVGLAPGEYCPRCGVKMPAAAGGGD